MRLYMAKNEHAEDVKTGFPKVPICTRTYVLFPNLQLIDSNLYYNMRHSNRISWKNRKLDRFQKGISSYTLPDNAPIGL